jgi:hypothetical protein
MPRPGEFRVTELRTRAYSIGMGEPTSGFGPVPGRPPTDPLPLSSSGQGRGEGERPMLVASHLSQGPTLALPRERVQIREVRLRRAGVVVLPPDELDWNSEVESPEPS